LQGGWYRFLVDAKINEIYFKANQLRSSDSDGEERMIEEILKEEYGIEF